MMHVEYNGIQGIVVGEQSIEGQPFVTWYIKLVTGSIVEAMMHECLIIAESIPLN